jgi:Fur family ferric uptake transcriptional regulator
MRAGRNHGSAEAGPVDDALARLRARGQRLTPARRVVLEVLASAKGHLAAEDVVTRATALQPGLHRATIYRTLDSLCASDVVVHVHTGHGATLYHLVDHGEAPHVHVSCDRCGGIFDAPSDLLDVARERLERAIGFRLEPSHTALLGTCAACLATTKGASR